MKVAVAQLAPGLDLAQNLERTVGVLREAAERGAELVVLPELCISPYQLGDEPLERWAAEIPGGTGLQACTTTTGRNACPTPVERWLQETKTLKLFLVAGLLEREGERYYNTAVVLGPQGVVAAYRKAHLFSWEQRLAAGNRGFLSVDIGLARLGVLICYDLRFVEAVRLLVLEGIQLLCVPTTWTDVGKPQPWDRHGLCAAAHLALGYAYANRIFVLCSNRVGTEKSVRYLGNSLIAGPRGEFLAGPAGPQETTVLVAEIDPQQADDKRIGKDNDLLADRRTDLYTIEAVRKVVAAGSQETKTPIRTGKETWT